MDAEKISSYVCRLGDEQRERLRKHLDEQGWVFSEQAHAYWKASRERLHVVAYLSGKLTVQGKGAGELVLYFIEPELLGEARLGYEELLSGDAVFGVADSGVEADWSAHAGLDESGKGDFFGPLVVAAVFVDAAAAVRLKKAGVKDCKSIPLAKIAPLASRVRQIVDGRFGLVSIGPEAYNRMYQRIGNLNRLLAWGHARALEDLLEKEPSCSMVLADKFGHESLIRNALMEKGRQIDLRQQVRAESDLAVAAASILARDDFLRRLGQLGREHRVLLPRGAGHKVDDTALELARKGGVALLRQLAKLHFKTAERALRAAGLIADGDIS